MLGGHVYVVTELPIRQNFKFCQQNFQFWTVFYQLLEQHINSVSGKFQDKFCVTQESYDQIKEVLATGKGEKCQFGSYFKFWCKKNYRLEKIGSLNVVYCVKTSCPVVAKESMFETLVKCHERVGHSGRRKTWDEVKKNYAGIRFDVIPLFLSNSVTKDVQPRILPVEGLWLHWGFWQESRWTW